MYNTSTFRCRILFGLLKYFLVMAFVITGHAQTNFSGQVEAVKRVNITPNEIEGLITISYDPGPLSGYLSIGAQNVTGGPVQIIVSNLFLADSSYISTQQTISKRFDINIFVSKKPGSVEQIPEMLILYFHLLRTRGCYPFEPSTFIYETMVTIPQIIDNATGDIAAIPTTEPTVVAPLPAPCRVGDIMETTPVFRSCSVPNIDLDSSAHPGTNTYAGDWNACVPTATSNSLMWLAKKDTSIKIPFSHRDLLDSLSKYMKRAKNQGTIPADFIRGKLEFIKAHKLKINVKFQSEFNAGDIWDSESKTYAKNMNSGTYPTWQFLKKEMDDGEDVEINYYWHNGTDWSGHSVVLTGAYEHANGTKEIMWKHDMRQDSAGGTKQEVDSLWLDQYGRLVIGSRRAYIGMIVAESPSPTGPFTSVDDQILSPFKYELAQNYPNPFNPVTDIKFTIREQGFVDLRVFDFIGREVAILVHESKLSGEYKIHFDAGKYGLTSGIYFYQLKCNKFLNTKKFILLK